MSNWGATFRAKTQFDLAGRPPYAWGLLTAADAARFFGNDKVTAIEFGVARGDGLIELCRLADPVTELTGVRFNIVGFDNGTGLPPPADYRDHPEVWSRGDFAMGDPPPLQQRFGGRARLILGDIADTLNGFLAEVSPDAPIGFCSFDTDTYTSSVASLRVYRGRPELYLPVGVAYCDDTLGGAGRFGSLCRNRKAGQLLAVDEFNASQPNRIIDTIRTLRYRRPLSHEQWIEQVYGVHILDHPARNRPLREQAMSMQEHGSAAWLAWP